MEIHIWHGFRVLGGMSTYDFVGLEQMLVGPWGSERPFYFFFIPNESVPDLFSGPENCVNMYYDMALN